MAFTPGIDSCLAGPWLAWVAVAAGAWSGATVPWEPAAAVTAVAAAAVASGTCTYVGQTVRRYSDYATTPICCGVLSIVATKPTHELA